MGKIIAVHSYKGGTGKTLMSINLATAFVTRGKKVCLLDLDFRAPSLYAALKADGSEYWLNDYLNGVCEIKRVLIDSTEKSGLNGGRLLLGLANPNTEAIRDMTAKDRKWEMRALGRLLALKNSLLNDMELDYIIFDTSPGLQYSSINAIVSADIVLVVTTQDTSDILGTRRMIQELYDLFDKKAALLLNKTLLSTTSFEKEIKEIAIRYEKTYNLPVLQVIPCFCDVLKAGGTFIFAKEKPDHPFTKILEEITTKIEKMEKC
ncbi:MAG: AAA family ATPase [Candidatus Bathyarchaeia archaeon]|jgi:septum site-determining protein MinD|nr:MinD/ParA family protein [Candidatus Bathyarchaeota archaeon A05DMB-4]MDH7595958.1 MinD/ParA family protein [Candidatus Bathyarchaeota archaeon]